MVESNKGITEFLRRRALRALILFSLTVVLFFFGIGVVWLALHAVVSDTVIGWSGVLLGVFLMTIILVNDSNDSSWLPRLCDHVKTIWTDPEY